MATPHRAVMPHQDWGRRRPPPRPRRTAGKRRRCVTPLLADHRDGPPRGPGFPSNRPRAKHLPRALPRTSNARSARMPVPATPAHAPLVLIANAQEWVTRSLESILRPAGYAVLKAYSGRDALEGARRSAPDVVILDTDLPETDVLALCRALRVDPYITPSTPILVTSPGPLARAQVIDARAAGGGERRVGTAARYGRVPAAARGPRAGQARRRRGARGRPARSPHRPVQRARAGAPGPRAGGAGRPPRSVARLHRARLRRERLGAGRLAGAEPFPSEA